MNQASRTRPKAAGTGFSHRWLAAVTTMLLLAGCSGGSGTGTGMMAQATACDPADASTYGECGTVMVALTDADGDFLNYTVDVMSLRLETANGRVVETMPRRTRINFADYVDLAELVTVASIPPATYISGVISLNYQDAEIFVEADGESKQAVVTDIAGNVLQQTELRIQLSDRDRLVVTRGRPALLQLDFDLDASHVVDIAPTPAVAAAEPFIVAEVTPVDEKDIRVRGLLVGVAMDSMSYSVAIRPFHDRSGDFGEVDVQATANTEFEIDEQLYVGADGLAALDAAGAGTPTVAFGTLDVDQRQFTASLVLAGSSVPGVDRDAVVGNVIRREGNLLTVRGATLIPSDRVAHFHDDVIVEVGPNTKVFRDGYRRRDLGIDAISIGQRVTIRGWQSTPVTDASTPEVLFDATEGAVRMHVTRLSGIVNAVMPGQTDMTLHAIDRRRASVFDFAGTGQSPELDADPDNYEIATGNLMLAEFAPGMPIAARGFPNAFGSAPPDFAGRTVIDYSDVRSVLGITWGIDGTSAPFISAGPDGLILDNDNADTGIRHYIKQGPILIDLMALDSDTTIVPRDSGPLLFYIKTADSLRLYSNFTEFVDDLTMSLDGATTARSLHARGEYDAAANILHAYKLGVHLLEP